MCTEGKLSPEEYRSALDIVERYHKQIMEESRLVNTAAQSKDGISISDFIESYVSPHLKGRMESILDEYMHNYGDFNVVEISMKNFQRLRNAGKKMWTEFETARDLYTKEIGKEE